MKEKERPAHTHTPTFLLNIHIIHIRIETAASFVHSFIPCSSSKSYFLRLCFIVFTLLQYLRRIMVTRCAFENSNEIGVFAALTNAYCLTGTYVFMNTEVDCFRSILVVLVFFAHSLTHHSLQYRNRLFGKLLFHFPSRIGDTHSRHPRHHRWQSLCRSHHGRQSPRTARAQYHNRHGIATFAQFIAR